MWTCCSVVYNMISPQTRRYYHSSTHFIMIPQRKCTRIVRPLDSHWSVTIKTAYEDSSTHKWTVPAIISCPPDEYHVRVDLCNIIWNWYLWVADTGDVLDSVLLWQEIGLDGATFVRLTPEDFETDELVRSSISKIFFQLPLLLHVMTYVVFTITCSVFLSLNLALFPFESMYWRSTYYLFPSDHIA